MWPWLRAIFLDEATFTQYARVIIFGLATIGPELIDVGHSGTWIAKVVAALALFLKAGDTTPPLVQQVKAMPPDEKATVSALLK